MFAITRDGNEAPGRRRRAKPAVFDRLRHRLEEGAPDDLLDELTGQIAQAVAAHRLRLNLSQAELAELCGTTQSAIARVEAGGRPPRIDTLQRIANALDCTLRVELEPRTHQLRSTFETPKVAHRPPKSRVERGVWTKKRSGS